MERIMKSKMNVIALMDRYGMRKNIGPYTFSFVEGKYLFCYHSHPTGRYLRIFIVAPDGDKMEVYYATEWYSSRYYFNGFGKGYTQGPWVKEIEALFAQFRSELISKLKEIRVNKRLNKIAKEQADAERYSKFAALCEHSEPLRGE